MEESSSSDDSSLLSISDGLTMSPVLSTSKLQTTPSPPSKGAILILISPILDPSRLLRPLPYIPELLIYLSQQSFQGKDACRLLKSLASTIISRTKAEDDSRNTGGSLDERRSIGRLVVTCKESPTRQGLFGYVSGP
ncbi:hypothetical protein IW261DRAFT_1575310 [Armillaria novae-zelandiae]|uniref:Uncharacterized protein n=1 Tax=Armillaria novae-zelandiae TaxID=153914 RepID=A0AA39TZY1_9AGAR|nr:hypothetical protein IW261DRAFT_1575310 [Armillaria novae-zelandiae]